MQCFGHISHAHVNPAITVGAVILGKKSIAEAMVYLVAQNLGAILGYGLLKVRNYADNFLTTMECFYQLKLFPIKVLYYLHSLVIHIFITLLN